MPSPFPGMDPFIESQEWDDFHTSSLTMIRDLLSPRLGDHYVARVERRVYVEYDPAWPDDPPRRRQIEPDVTVSREQDGSGGTLLMEDTAVATTIECDLPEPQTHREVYLVLKNIKTHEIVTVLELLSPANKRSGSEGNVQYLRKRDEVLRGKSHLVEIDLLRGGARMPMRLHRPLAADYIALLSRSDRRPKAELVAWSLRHKLPTISIPLAQGDPDIPLDLQTVLDTVYDRARYDRTLDYAAPLLPPASKEIQQWIAGIIEYMRPPDESRES